MLKHTDSCLIVHTISQQANHLTYLWSHEHDQNVQMCGRVVVEKCEQTHMCVWWTTKIGPIPLRSALHWLNDVDCSWLSAYFKKKSLFELILYASTFFSSDIYIRVSVLGYITVPQGVLTSGEHIGVSVLGHVAVSQEVHNWVPAAGRRAAPVEDLPTVHRCHGRRPLSLLPLLLWGCHGAGKFFCFVHTSQGQVSQWLSTFWLTLPCAQMHSTVVFVWECISGPTSISKYFAKSPKFRLQTHYCRLLMYRR